MAPLTATTRDDWERAVSDHLVPVTIPSVEGPFVGTIDRTLVADDLAFSIARSAGCVIERRADHIDDSQGGSIIFSLQTEGLGTASQGSRKTSMTPGRGAFVTTDAPYRLESPGEHRGLAIRVGTERLGLSVREIRAVAVRSFGDDDVTFRFLRGFVTTIAESWDEIPGTARATYVKTAADLLTTMLWESSRDAPRASGSTPTLDRARRAVLDHLEDPDLDVAFLARELGVSTRTVHAAFAAVELSAAEFIRRHRLERASRQLLATSRPIIEIAVGVGFSDITTFMRAFKRRFGTTPGRWRGSGAGHPLA